MKYKFEQLINTQVSVAIDTCKPKSPTVKENYQGIIREVYEDFIVLDFIPTPHLRDTTLQKLVIRKTAIISMWIYDKWEAPGDLDRAISGTQPLAKQIYGWLRVRKGGQFTNKEIFRIFGITHKKDKRNVNMILWRLREKGLLEKMGTGYYKITTYPFEL